MFIYANGCNSISLVVMVAWVSQQISVVFFISQHHSSSLASTAFGVFSRVVGHD
jgi:hypothetical protein